MSDTDVAAAAAAAATPDYFTAAAAAVAGDTIAVSAATAAAAALLLLLPLLLPLLQLLLLLYHNAIRYTYLTNVVSTKLPLIIHIGLFRSILLQLLSDSMKDFGIDEFHLVNTPTYRGFLHSNTHMHTHKSSD